MAAVVLDRDYADCTTTYEDSEYSPMTQFFKTTPRAASYSKHYGSNSGHSSSYNFFLRNYLNCLSYYFGLQVILASTLNSGFNRAEVVYNRQHTR